MIVFDIIGNLISLVCLIGPFFVLWSAYKRCGEGEKGEEE